MEGSQVTLSSDDESWMRLDNDPVPDKRPTLKTSRGRGKLIMLEDLLRDRQKKQRRKQEEMRKQVRKESQSSEGSDDDSDDSDEKTKRLKVEELLDVNHQFHGGEEDMPVKWGLSVFGEQKPFLELTVADSDDGLISQFLKLKGKEGVGKPLESLISSGFLYSWVILKGLCDELTARWLFHQMAYSRVESLEKDTCKILCDLLEQTTGDGRPLCTFKWLPSLEEIMDVFHTYGYLEASDHCDMDTMKSTENTANMPSQEGNAACELYKPPRNIRSLLQFLVAYFETRKLNYTLPVPAAEKFLVTIVRLLLDRCLLSVQYQLQQCLHAVVNYFSEDDWILSCKRVATSLSRINSAFINNLQVAKKLHSPESRIASLQRQVVLQLLSTDIEAKAVLSSPRDVVSIFKSKNVKDKKCNFANVYYLLILADIYLWTESTIQTTRTVSVLWLEFLKRCSTQISTQDPRPFATKVRNWASFLCQKYQIEELHSSFMEVLPCQNLES